MSLAHNTQSEFDFVPDTGQLVNSQRNITARLNRASKINARLNQLIRPLLPLPDCLQTHIDTSNAPKTATMSTTPPPPPLHFFRIIKTISNGPNIRTTLCLPRDLEAPVDIASSALLTSIHACGTSKLLSNHMRFIPQLSLVHTATDSDTVRNISNNILISRARASQISFAAEDSWVCEAPIFGPTLMEFCKAYTIANNGLGGPSWFLAHVFFELIEAVCDGGVKKEVSAEHVRLNIHPGKDEEEEWGFRSYPSIILDTATAPPEPFPEAVARGVVELIRDIVFEESDSAPFIRAAGSVMVTTDPLLLILGEMQEMLTSGTPFDVQDLGARFRGRLSDLRVTGPERLPRDIAQHVHADLMGGEELDKGMKEPVVIKFEEKYDEFLKLDAGEEVRMGEGEHAGMRTGRIMVVRFGARKADFLTAVGETVEDEEEEDVVLENYF